MLMTILNVIYVLVAVAMIALILMQRGAGAQPSLTAHPVPARGVPPGRHLGQPRDRRERESGGQRRQRADGERLLLFARASRRGEVHERERLHGRQRY